MYSDVIASVIGAQIGANIRAQRRKNKVRIFKVRNEWRASLFDAYFAIGISPRDAYQNLSIYVMARRPDLVRKYMPHARFAKSTMDC